MLSDPMLLDPPPHKHAVGERQCNVELLLNKGFGKALLGKYRLCQTEEVEEGRNSCSCLSDTCPGDMVLRMPREMVTPWGQCKV